MFSLDAVYSIDSQFLANFPEDVRGFVSLGLGILLVYGIYKVVRKQFIFIIVLIVLLPASVPILKNIWQEVLRALQFLINR